MNHMARGVDLEGRAVEAYLYYYPLVMMELTRTQLCANALRRGHDLVTQPMIHNRNIANAKWRSVARTNIDTLFSSCWLDTANGPATMTLPESGPRYFMYQVLDMWSDTFAVLGSRTLDGRDTVVHFLPPDTTQYSVQHQPQGPTTTHVRTPTRFSWIIGRTYASTEPDDLNGARQHQAGVALAYTKGPSALHDVDMDSAGEAPVAVADRMSPEEFFELADYLHRREGAHATDTAQLLRLRTLGLANGKPFSFANQSREVRRALTNGYVHGAELSRDLAAVNATSGQWEQFHSSIGVYGNDYQRRAIIARYGLAANPREDAVYISAHHDDRGRPLHSNERYSMHFGTDRLPPAEFFWSITAYDSDGQFMDNPWSKYGVRSKDALHYNRDGSLDLEFGPNPPGSTPEANWVPTTGDRFTVTLRLYGPNAEVLSGAWQPPQICWVPGE